MKTLRIEHAAELNDKNLRFVDDYFDHHLRFEYIDMLNWPREFPYKPMVRFKAVRSDRKLYLKYYVVEKNIRAIWINDQDPVWTDSCVEFFFRPADADFYYNFEFNCIGTCLATRRKGRNEAIVPLSTEQMNAIGRFPSLGTEPFEEKSGLTEWKLTVEIPLEIIGLNSENLDQKASANFYKCGDETQFPHYLSWNHIQTEKPDFHRPEFFGEILF